LENFAFQQNLAKMADHLLARPSQSRRIPAARSNNQQDRMGSVNLAHGSIITVHGIEREPAFLNHNLNLTASISMVATPNYG
jgi:hypothetical protein